MLEMRNIAIGIYLISAVLQLVAFIIAIRQTKKMHTYKSGWVLLSLGLFLMLSRRAQPAYLAIIGDHYSLSDAVFALVVSSFLLGGLVRLRNLFDLMQRQEQQLAKQARYDSLTGVLSRVGILDQATIAMERCVRLKRPIAVLILDMDKFKAINDNFGHAAGDQVLKDFAVICKNSLRNIDLFGRMGGDEFLAILSEAEIEIVLTIAQRLVTEVNSAKCLFEDNTIKISTSIGVAFFDPEFLAQEQALPASELVDQLIRIADLNMYTAKKEHGNKLYYSPNQYTKLSNLLN